MTAAIPGAINLDADELTDDMIVALGTTGPRSAQTTLANIAQYVGSESLGNVSNTNISTVGAGTLTAAGLKGGLITRSGSTAAYTDTTATAAQLLAALGADAVVGTAWIVDIKNTVAFAETLAGGTDVTLSGQTIIPPNSVGRFLLTYSAATPAFTMRGISVGPMTTAPLEANTAITTVGAGALTAAALVGGVITRTGPTAAYTDTTNTAAQIIAALPNGNVGQSWEVTIKNTVPFAATLAGGTDVTLSGQTIIPPNSVGRFLLTVATATTVTMQGLVAVPMTTGPLLASTALTTVGAGTITAAGIVGGITIRTGSTADFVDTTDTAVAIIAALPNANIGQSFIYRYENNTLGAASVTGGVGVSAAAVVGIVPATMWADFLVTYSAAATVTMVLQAMGPLVALPASKYTTGTAATFAAGAITGANFVNYENTASNATLTVRTAAQMFGDIPNCKIGFSYQLAIRNTNATGATITADGGATVTLTGTMTIAQDVTRLFNVVFPSATTCTITSMGISAAGA